MRKLSFFLLFSVLLIPFFLTPLASAIDYTQAPQGGSYYISTPPPTSPSTVSTTYSLPPSSTLEVQNVSDAKNGIGLDYLQIIKEYLDVSIEQPSNNRLRTEIASIAITDHIDHGIVGKNEQEQKIYKDTLTVDWIVRGYTSYSTSDFYSKFEEYPRQFIYRYWTELSIITKKQYLFYLIPMYIPKGTAFTYTFDVKTGAWNDPFNYVNFGSGSVNPARVQGENLDLDISLQFRVPVLENSNYDIASIDSYVLSMETVSTASIQSISTTAYTNLQMDAVEKPSSADSMPIITDNGLDVISFGSVSREDDWTYLKSGMSTNVRLATGDKNVLTGSYKMGLGCSAYRYVRDMNYKSAQINTNIFGTDILKSVISYKMKQYVAPGVENFAVSQILRAKIEVYSTYEQRETVVSPSPIAELPAQNETIYLQDPDVDVPSIWWSNDRTYLYLLIAGIAIGVIFVIGFVIFKVYPLMQLRKTGKAIQGIERNTRK